MKLSDKTKLKILDARKALNDLVSESNTAEPEKRAELSTQMETRNAELRQLEVRYESELLLEGTETVKVTDTGTDTRDRLVQRSDIAEIFASSLTGQLPDGATRELQTELKLDGNQIPLELLRRGEVPELEVRTSGVTPIPATGSVGLSQAPIIPAVFPQGAVSFLRIPQPSVGVGERVYTTVSTSISPGTPAKGTDQSHSEGAFSAVVLAPKRIQASFFIAREDRARLSGMAAALRSNMNMALSDKLDKEILGNLLTGTNLANHDATAADTYASYRRRFAYDAVDGRYASMVSQLRLLVGSDTYGDMAATYRSSSSDMNALGALMAETAGVRVSANLTATASSKQEGIVRRGGRMDSVSPVWQGISVISDEVTQAKAGEIVFTGIMLFSFAILRAAGFRKVEAQHA